MNEKRKVEAFICFAKLGLVMAVLVSLAAVPILLTLVGLFPGFTASRVVGTLLAAVSIGPAFVAVIGGIWAGLVSLGRLEAQAAATELENIRLTLWPSFEHAQHTIRQYTVFALTVLVLNLAKDIVALFVGGQ